MEKSLPGSFHATYEFCSTHWRGLIAASLLPVGVIAIVTTLSWIYMGDLLSAAMFSRFNQTIEFKQHLISLMGTAWLKLVLLGLISFFATAWHFTRVAQYRRDENVSLFGIRKGEFTSVANLIGYYIAISLLIALCYLGLAFVVLIVGLIVRAIFGEGVIMWLIVAPVVLAAFLLLVIIFMRFALAFPQVALGRWPNIFSQMFPLAKGEVWSGFWRLLLLIGGFVIFGFILQLIFVMPIASQFSDQLFDSSGAIDAETISRISIALVPYGVIAQIFGAFAVTITTVLLVEMNFRLLQKKSSSTR